MTLRRKWDQFDGRLDPAPQIDLLAPPPAEPESVEQLEPTPWAVATPPRDGDPTAFLAAMRQTMRQGHEVEEARKRRRRAGQ
jgi:hypothetical protein